MISVNSQLHNKDLEILSQLEKLCWDVAPVRTARLAAAVAIRGEVLSWGTNEGMNP
jgi:hypothetical protein